MGCDVYRDYVNTPAFFAMLPNVSGLRGLDIGCGKGHNTRLAARRGAKLTAIDISRTFIRHAREAERKQPFGIDYRAASAVDLPFPDESFDFTMATMSFMDIPEHEKVISEVYRVLKPGGFLQFSITHPCFMTPHLKSVRDETGKKVAYEVGDYFRPLHGQIDEWIFSAAPPDLKAKLPKFRVPRFTRTLSSWMNLLVDAGFVIERLGEPCADEETAKRCPDVADTRIVACFLHVRCRKR
jgi:SAM-dependent methyltransferase